MNTANRTYDSNGPDVKVRGTAAHIYDKYQILARDASSAGDRIAAENYLQHAEHYFRLMAAHAAAQQQQQQANGQPGNGQHAGGQPPRANGQVSAHAGDGDIATADDEAGSDGNGHDEASAPAPDSGDADAEDQSEEVTA